MWVFTRDGFFAVVFKACQRDEIMIKAKSKADLLALLQKVGDDSPVHEITESDYRFYVILKKRLWSQYLTEYLESLDYESVRDHIVSPADTARHQAYQTVWTTMYNWMGRESLTGHDS